MTGREVVWDEERRARAALTCVCEAGSLELVHLVAQHGAVATWEALRNSRQEGRWARRARDLDLDGVLEQADRHQVGFLVPTDPHWPEQLTTLDAVQFSGMGGSPLGLWVRGPGRLAEWSALSVAIVGSRASSAYGDRVATDLAIDLAGAPNDLTVLSGGAYGIDAAAHRGAAAAGGRTIALLACGLDAPYPSGNQALFDRLVAEHLLVSEVPCGMRPTKAGFLARNRLIAALAQGTVVVEAALRSGANNTASWALECERILMAVPGSVHSSLSGTPHRLISQGKASLVTGADDVLALVGPLRAQRAEKVGGQARLFDDVEPELMAVREVLPGRGGMPPGEVARRAGLSMGRALASLGRLEQMQLVRLDPTGRWRLATPPAVGGGAS